MKTCSSTVIQRYDFLVRCSMVCTAASNQKPHTCKSAMLPTVNPRHRSGVARGRAPSRWPLVRTARPSRCPRPTCNTSKRGCPPRRHTRRHLAPSSMGPGRTSTQKRVTFGGELAQKGTDRLGHSRGQLAEHHRPVRARQLELVHRCPRQVLQRAQEDAFTLVRASVHKGAAHGGRRRGHVRVEQPIACVKVARGVGGETLEHSFVVD